MTIKSTQSAITTAASQINVIQNETHNSRDFGLDLVTKITLYTTSAVVYIGGSDVTSSNGFLLRANVDEKFDLNSDELDSLYAVTSTGTATVFVLNTGV